MGIEVLIPLALLAVLLVAGVASAFSGGGNNLPAKFAELGNIRGKPIEDIVAAVGPANSISSAADGMLYQWQKFSAAGGAHYAILVDSEGKAIGYTHQHVS